MSLIAAFCTKSVVLGAPHATSDKVATAAIKKLRIPASKKLPFELDAPEQH